MSDTKNISASKYKNCDNFTVTDNFGNTYLFVRSGKGFFNIAKCEVNTDGHIDDNDGLIPNAVPYHPEEVAYLVAEAEERQRCLESIESLVEELIDVRRSKSRKAKAGLKQIQRKEVAK